MVLTHLASRRVLLAVAERLGHHLDPDQTDEALSRVKDRAYRLNRAEIADADFARYLESLSAPVPTVTPAPTPTP